MATLVADTFALVSLGSSPGAHPTHWRVPWSVRSGWSGPSWNRGAVTEDRAVTLLVEALRDRTPASQELQVYRQDR